MAMLFLRLFTPARPSRGATSRKRGRARHEAAAGNLWGGGLAGGGAVRADFSTFAGNVRNSHEMVNFSMKLQNRGII